MNNRLFELFFLLALLALYRMRKPYLARPVAGRVIADRVVALDHVMARLYILGAYGIPILYILSPWLDFADYELPVQARQLGVALAMAAVWLMWRSHLALGCNWAARVVLRDGHRLVVHGVYRRIRHPIYAAFFLWAGAQALLLPNWIAGLSNLAVMLPYYGLRIGREEQMMLDHFGDEYRLYMERTGALVPRLWR